MKPTEIETETTEESRQLRQEIEALRKKCQSQAKEIEELRQRLVTATRIRLGRFQEVRV